MKQRSTWLFLVLATFVLLLMSCTGDAQQVDTPATEAGVSSRLDDNNRYIATIITNLGSIKIELFAKEVPNTVNNFVNLSKAGFYEGVIFHRVIPNFMIQGGDPTGTGTGGPGYTFEDEFHASLEFDKPGLLAMANAGPDTNGSQFFITTVPTPHLTGAHTIFGRTLDGQGVVEAISRVPISAGHRPVQDVRIQFIQIEVLPES